MILCAVSSLQIPATLAQLLRHRFPVPCITSRNRLLEFAETSFSDVVIHIADYEFDFMRQTIEILHGSFCRNICFGDVTFEDRFNLSIGQREAEIVFAALYLMADSDCGVSSGAFINAPLFALELSRKVHVIVNRGDSRDTRTEHYRAIPRCVDRRDDDQHEKGKKEFEQFIPRVSFQAT